MRRRKAGNGHRDTVGTCRHGHGKKTGQAVHDRDVPRVLVVPCPPGRIGECRVEVTLPPKKITLGKSRDAVVSGDDSGGTTEKEE